MVRGALSLCGVVAALLALPALAQTTTTSALELGAGNSFSNSFTVGAGDCSLKLRVRWRYNYSVGPLCTPLKLWSTDGECGETPGTNDVRYDDVPNITVSTVREGTFDVAIDELPGFKEGTATPCGSANLTKTHKVCGSMEYNVTSCGFSTASKLQASALKIVYDTQPPTAPTITDATALDNSARVNFSVSSDAAVVIAEVRAQGTADFSAGGEVLASAGSIKVSGLVNGTTYDIRLRAKDEAGNVGEPSDPVAVTPIKTIGFWGAYRYKGGTDQGGCSSAPGLLFPLALLWTLRRRRR
ncbi:MAG: MXAN_2561 family MXYO-CTERM-anchored protein [Myxococcota bacterium]